MKKVIETIKRPIDKLKLKISKMTRRELINNIGTIVSWVVSILALYISFKLN